MTQASSVPAQRSVADRERFLTFAFAAADLLVEAAPDGRIAFATGAFPSRLGCAADSMLGHPVEAMVAPEDRAALGTALALLGARGRLAPMAVRLADANRTAFAVSGLVAPGDGRLALCFAPAPTPMPEAAELPDGPGFAAAEARLRTGAAGALSVFELAGPDGVIAPRPELRTRIGEALAAGAGPGALTGELAAGRFGVVAAEGLDLQSVAASLETLLQDSGIAAQVASSALPLAAEGLTGLQATRALRFALSAFAHGGAAGLAAAGFEGGLPGFVAAAGARAGQLRRAIEERRFRLAFQPIVDLDHRAPHHYEALLRPQPVGGQEFGKVQDFVTFAETVGLSEELDWAVVAAACDAAREAQGARIACNLSGLSLQSPEFRARFLALLDAEPLLVERLLVEITETSEIENERAAVRTVEALRDRGLPLCLDDFGAGAAAFRYLRAFRVDIVKVDGLYVRGAAANGRDRGFVAAMVDLARTVGAEVVAEQIETEAVAAVMHGLGVRYGQGWLFGRPGALPGRGG